MSATERTFVLVKPDGVQRSLVADIIARFERRGYKLVALKFLKASEDLLKKHYDDLKSSAFFAGLIKNMSSGPVVAMVWEGLDIVAQGRAMLGETDPLKSKPGTIRGDFSISISQNVIHGSSSSDVAAKEISLWFSAAELVEWTPVIHGQVY